MFLFIIIRPKKHVVEIIRDPLSCHLHFVMASVLKDLMLSYLQKLSNTYPRTYKKNKKLSNRKSENHDDIFHNLDYLYNASGKISVRNRENFYKHGTDRQTP